MFTDSDLDRFWAKVKKRGPGECWPWTGARIKQDYGNFYVQGHWWRAHRAAWVIANGPIPDGLYVCHECDNTSCVNPAHLYLGTQAQNLADMTARGRRNYKGPAGEANRHAKLTETQVLKIRRRHDNGEMQVDLAREFKLAHSTMSALILRKTWKHI